MNEFQELTPGSLFAGRYEVIRRIGEGAMGAVYLACDPRYRDFLVALKVIYPDILASKKLREWFRQEMIVSFGVHHRNIVQAYDYFDEDGVQAYAMEYIEGEDLFDYLEQGALSYKETASILKQVCLALVEIHRKGVLHRDLKPENILIHEDGVVKVADFGVACAKTEDDAQGLNSQLVGTPKYLAPEYIESGVANQQTDIYALGMIAYELISGVTPYPDDLSLGDQVELLNKPLKKLSDIVTDTDSVKLVEIIEKAGERDPAKRYKSTRAMYLDIENIT